jgi:hypothetical protein
MPVPVILSPHLDDAVFSCWHLLDQPQSRIITIFAGVPPASTSTLWDRLCGTSNSEAMMHTRLSENQATLQGTNATHYELDYLDNQYRKSAPEIAQIAEEVLNHAPVTAHFFASLAGSRLWQHPDHIIVRQVGEYLLLHGEKVSFYADLPYMQMPAHPDNPENTDMAVRVRHARRAIAAISSAEVYELTPAQQLAKLKASKCYRTQYSMTNLVSGFRLGRRANIQREIVYYVANGTDIASTTK